MDSNPIKPKSPDWLHEFQAPQHHSLPSSPSSSSERSDFGERHDVKSTGETREKAVTENFYWQDLSLKAFSRKQGTKGEAEGTGKRKKSVKDAVACSHKRVKGLSKQSAKETEDDDDDVPIAVLSRKPLRDVKKPGKDSGQPAAVKAPTTEVNRFSKQTTLENLFTLGRSPQKQDEPELGMEELVSSQFGDSGLVTEEPFSSQVDDQHREDVPDLKIEHETDVVGSQEPRVKAKVPSSLPLVFPDKVHLSKMLVECDGDALDLSGDMGAVGRFSLCGQNNELLMDLKGVIYKAGIVPSNTFMVVNIGPNEAKVEAIMDNFMQLRVDTHKHEDETMVEGTLEGITFVSDDEEEKVKPNPPAADEGEDSGSDSGKPPKKKKISQAQKPTKKAAVKKVKVVVKAGKGGRTSKAGGKLGTTKRSKPATKSTPKSKRQSRK